jgi:aspartate dehydrogenase
MNLGIIGAGTIGNYVCLKATERGHRVGAILRRASASRDGAAGAVAVVTSVAKLPPDIEHVIDCAGHEALKAYGADILRRGIDLTTVSLGALADESLHRDLVRAARDGDSRLHLVSGAIGALDCLRAARVGGLTKVTYSGRKPASSWKGTPAEEAFDLDGLCAPETIFEGSAREASAAYPKNANVAAAVALAGLGFDGTSVRLIADPRIGENVHEVEAQGEFGEFAFRIVGRAVPDNPRTSALAAMSVISSLEQETESIRFY